MDEFRVERFTADWCGPCRAFQPVFDRVVDEYDLNSEVYDIDTQSGMTRAEQYGIKGIPAVIINGVHVPYQEFESTVRDLYEGQ